MQSSNGDVISMTMEEKKRLKRAKQRAAKKLRIAQRLESGEPTPIKNPLGLLASFYCQTCCLKLDSQIAFDNHLSGSKHTKRLKGPNLCDICHVLFGTETSLETHIAGIKHQRRAKAVADPPIFCDSCQKLMPNREKYEEHLAGDKHQKKSQRKWCHPCNSGFLTDADLAEHEEGPKHYKRLKSLELIQFLDSPNSGFTKDVKTGAYTCIPCNESFIPKVLAGIPEHILSREHSDKLSEMGDYEPVDQPPKKKRKKSKSQAQN